MRVAFIKLVPPKLEDLVDGAEVRRALEHGCRSRVFLDDENEKREISRCISTAKEGCTSKIARRGRQNSPMACP